MPYRMLAALVAASLLAGCQALPRLSAPAEPQNAALPADCDAEIPVLASGECQLDSWVAFGLASQRGDRAWRDTTLARLKGGDSDVRLARAAVLAWGSEREWDLASNIYKAEIHSAPADIQPLLRYWFNELEGRRAQAGRLAQSEAQRNQLANQNEQQATRLEELEDKLEALTDIEQSMNQRQQAP